MKLVVDLSVLIDLFNGNILHRFSGLCDKIYISQLGFSKLDNERGLGPDEVLRFGIIIYRHESIEVSEIANLSIIHQKLSDDDLGAFVAAKSLSAILLTGDKRLKKLSETQNVNSHGTLWVMDEMVAKNLISKNEAFDALKLMLHSGSHLPISEV